MPQKHIPEGYLLIDHRACPGLQPEGLPVLFEAAFYVCSHCQRTVIKRPERVRPRHYCRKCDHDICDQCEAERVASGYECRDYKRVVEKIIEGAREP